MNPKGNAHVRANRRPESRTLTLRERNVLGLLATGISYQEIGDQLRLKRNTVHNLIGRIFDKTGFSSRYEVAAWYWKQERDGLHARIAELESQLRTPSLAAAALLEQAVAKLRAG